MSDGIKNSISMSNLRLCQIISILQLFFIIIYIFRFFIACTRIVFFKFAIIICNNIPIISPSTLSEVNVIL